MGRVFDTVEEFWGPEFLQQAYDMARSSRADLVECFESRFVDYLGTGGVSLFVPTGRAALRIALSVAETRGRKRVLVPAFCGYSVGDAIVEAGMRPMLIDSGSAIGSIDWNACDEALKRDDVAAVVFPHLFGLPLDIRPLLARARHHGVVVIENCAHCLGGQVEGVPAGAFGDIAFFSFNYDKPMFLGGGGMLVCNPSPLVARYVFDRARALQSTHRPDPATERQELEDFSNYQTLRRSMILDTRVTRREQLSRLRRRFLNNVYLRWLACRIVPRYGLKGGFRLPATVGSLRAALGLALMEQYPEVMVRRVNNYNFLADQINDRNVGELIRPAGHISPAWLRAKLMMPERWEKSIDALGRFLSSQGFRAGRFNWGCTLDQEVSMAFKARRIGSLDNAHRMAKLSIDLPIHQNMEFRDLRRMAACIMQARP